MRLKLFVVFVGMLILVAAVMFVAGLNVGTFRVERSAELSAPADVVFAQLDDLQRWPEWHPWLAEVREPTFSGAAHGVGATCEWDREGLAGKSRISIVTSEPPTGLEALVEAERRKQSAFRLAFRLAPTATGTRVSMTITGQDTVFSRLFPRTNDMLGRDLDKTLARLRSATQAARTATAAVPQQEP